MSDNWGRSYNHSAASNNPDPSVSTSNYGNEPKCEADPNAPPPSYEDVVFNALDIYSQPGTSTQVPLSSYANSVHFNRNPNSNNIYTIAEDDAYRNHVVAIFLNNPSQSGRIVPVHAEHSQLSNERSTPTSHQSTNRQNLRTTLNDSQRHNRGSMSLNKYCPADDCLTVMSMYTLCLLIFLVIVLFTKNTKRQ